MGVPVIEPAPLPQILEQVGHGLAVVGPDLTLRLWNRNYSDLLGLPEGLCRPDAPYRYILEHRAASELVTEGVEDYVRAQMAVLFRARPASRLRLVAAD